MRSLKAYLILSRLRVFNALTTFCFQVSDHFRAAFISPLHPIQLVILHDPTQKINNNNNNKIHLHNRVSTVN